jgi:hypothetical protein
LTFGYSSDWFRFFGLTGPKPISQTAIGDHSAAMLEDLAALRDRTTTVRLDSKISPERLLDQRANPALLLTE